MAKRKPNKTRICLLSCLTVGVVAGFYSSVFVSGNIWIEFKKLAKHKNVA